MSTDDLPRYVLVSGEDPCSAVYQCSWCKAELGTQEVDPHDQRHAQIAPIVEALGEIVAGDTDTDDTRREDEPGDWFVADFDGECSRGGCAFTEDVTIRADGDGGWECWSCVDEDEFRVEQWSEYRAVTQ